MSKSKLEALIRDKRAARDRQLEKLHDKLEQLQPVEQSKWSRILAASFEDLQDALQSGTFTAVDVLHAFQWNCLKANDVTNGVTGLIEEAERWAQELDEQFASDNNAARNRPLFGIPFSIKEQLEMTGLDVTFGFAHRLAAPRAQTDAVCIQTMREAGAIPFVRTNIPQGMVSFNCSNPIYGLTTHPLKNSRTPGGSSGGEGAILSLRGAPFGLGTDGGGSIRLPSGFCGVAGLKPTMTRVSQLGVGVNLPGTVVLGVTWGPMAPSVDALVAVMRTACSPSLQVRQCDPYVWTQPFDVDRYASTRPLRIGYYDFDGYTESLAPMKRAVHLAKDALAGKGHELGWVLTASVSYQPPNIALGLSLFFSIFLPDGGAELKRWLKRDIWDEYNSGFFTLLSVPGLLLRLLAWILSPLFPRLALMCSGPRRTSDELRDAYARVLQYRRDTVELWRHMQLDAVICPPCAHPAATHRLPDKVGLGATYSSLYNVLDFAAGCVPVTSVNDDDVIDIRASQCQVGCVPNYTISTDLYARMIRDDFSTDEIVGFPVGVQVVALPNDEEMCLRVMKQIENASNA